MDAFFRDLRYAVVTLRRSPAFLAAALATVAVSVGATTAVFSIVYGVLFRPLPYPESDRLVRVWEVHPGGESPVGQRWLSNHTYEAWQRRATLTGLGAYGRWEYTVLFGTEAARLAGSMVSPQVFTMLGAAPLHGRLFTNDDAAPGAERVTVIGERVWRERFAGDPQVIGKTMTIDWEPYTVVGVARPEFRFPDSEALFWIPYRISPVASAPERTMVFTSLGQLAPGISPEQAAAEGTAAARTAVRPRSTDLFFGKGEAVVVRTRPLSDDLTTSVRPALLVLGAAVALVLLISCGNLANLFLSRGVSRTRELAVRAAIGGSAARLMRQLLTESLLVGLLGGVLGLLLAWGLIALVPAVAPARMPRLEDVRLDRAVLGFGMLAALFSMAVSGLLPAVRGARVDLFDVLRTSEAGGGSRRGNLRIRNALLIVEAAFAVVLLVGALLLARSFIRLTHVDAGYSAAGVATARIQFPRNTPDARIATFIDALLARLRALPEVAAAGAGTMMPLVSMTAITQFSLPSSVTGAKPSTVRSLTYVVTPGYAEALGLRLKSGRLLADADRRSGHRAVLVNEEFVRRHLSAANVIGLEIGDLYAGERGTRTTIVGVVGNMLKDGNDRDPQPEIFFVHGSATRQITGFLNVVVRSTGDVSAMAPSIRAIVRDLDETAVVERVAPLATMVAASLEQPRFAIRLMVAFAAIAVLLASIGLHGVLSYTVSQRRRELALRAALGAGRRDLVGMVVRQGVAVTTIGVAAGLAAAAAGARLMRHVLFETAPLDPVAFTLAPLVLVTVGLIACLVPALRAAAVDPASALRGD